MKLYAVYLVEVRRMVRSGTIWLAGLLCLCAPLAGYLPLLRTSSVESLSIQLIANPVLAGTITGAVVFAAVALAEASRPMRSGMDVLTDAVISPGRRSIVRMLALVTLIIIVTGVCACVYLPFTAARMDYLFHPEFYFACYAVFMIPTWCISVFFVEALYQITCSAAVTILIYGACVYGGFSTYASEDYFLRWINPYVVSLSDGFISYWPLRIGLYTRMMWLCVAAGLWIWSLICIRRYGKKLAGSFLYGIRRGYLPVLAALLLASGLGLWKSQPFIDNGPEEFVEETDVKAMRSVKTSAIRYFVSTSPWSGRVSARAEYDMIRPYIGEDLLEINPGYEITKMTYGGKPVDFLVDERAVNGICRVRFSLPEQEKETLIIEYEGIPAIAAYVASFMVDESADRDYIQLRGTSIAPLTSYTCKKGAEISFTIPGDLTPYLDFAPMTDCVDNGDGTKTWTASCDTYVMDFAAGRYVMDRVNAAGLDIDFSYGKDYRKAVDKYQIREALAKVFEYCGEHYGALDQLKDNRLLLIQKSIMIMGGFAHPGICEWFETVLSPLTLSDPQRGASATEVFIHEMVHQWWGGFGLECDITDIWSDEGLTVYSTYRIARELYGELYAGQYYVEQWKQAVKQQERNFYYRHPEYLSVLPERYQAGLREKNEGTNLYMRMPLMILKAEQLVGGEKQMDRILKKMYQDRERYSDGKLFTYEDFLDYCGLEAKDLEL